MERPWQDMNEAHGTIELRTKSDVAKTHASNMVTKAKQNTSPYKRVNYIYWFRV